jgi:hypothetical protein
MVPNPYRIGGTVFFPSMKGGTGTVRDGIRIPVPVPVAVPVPGNQVFPVFIREFPDLVPVPYRISGPDFFFTLFRSPGTVPYIGNGTVSVRYRYGSGSVPGFGSKCSSLVPTFGRACRVVNCIVPANKVSRVLPDGTSSDNSPGVLTNDSDEEEDKTIVKICELVICELYCLC